MAMTLVPVGEVTYTFQDKNGRKGKTGYNFLSSLTVADAQAAAEDIGVALQAASGAALLAISINYRLADPAVTPASAQATSNVFHKGSISFEGDSPNIKSRIEIPAVLDSLFPVGSEYADPTTGALAAVIAAYLNPTLGAGTGPVSAGGQDLTRQVGLVKEIGRRNT